MINLPTHMFDRMVEIERIAKQIASSVWRNHPIENSVDAPIYNGIYFLISNSKVVYIGKSSNVLVRIGQHSKAMKFDRFASFEVEKEITNHVERFLIYKFKPEMNLNMNPRKKRPSTK